MNNTSDRSAECTEFLQKNAKHQSAYAHCEAIDGKCACTMGGHYRGLVSIIVVMINMVARQCHTTPGRVMFDIQSAVAQYEGKSDDNDQSDKGHGVLS